MRQIFSTLFVMAAIVISLGGSDGATCSYTYDDVTNVMTTLTAANTGTNAHTISASALNVTTFAPVAAGHVTLAPGATRTWDITVLALTMVDHIGKNGTHYLSPPYIMSCAVS